MKRQPARPATSIRGQTGAALLTVLLVVALAASVVSGLIWRSDIEVHRVSNQQQVTQARWVLDGAIEWVQSLLRWQARQTPNATYLGGAWALPLQPTRLKQLLGGSDQDGSWLDQTWLSGSIQDAQASFNLTSLIRRPAPGQLDIDPAQLAILHRLLQQLGLPGELATPIAQRILRQVSRDRNDALPPLHDLNQLLDLAGINQAALQRLEPYLCVLPEPTPINANTASAQVLLAALPGVAGSAIDHLLQQRSQVYLRNIGDLQVLLQVGLPPDQALDLGSLDVDSHYFIVQLQAKVAAVTVRRRVLLYRAPNTAQTRIFAQ